MLDANGKRLTGAAFRDDLGKKIAGVDGVEPSNGLRIMRQVQPGSNSQFQHLTMETREQIRAQVTEFFSRHDPLHEAGENVCGVESHRRAQYTKDLFPRRPQILLSLRGLC